MRHGTRDYFLHASWYKRLFEVVYRWASYFCKSIFLDLCVWLFYLHICMYVHHLYVWCWQGSEVVRSCETRVKDCCESPYECWEPIPCLLQEQVPLTSEPVFQPQLIFLMCNRKGMTSISNPWLHRNGEAGKNKVSLSNKV